MNQNYPHRLRMIWTALPELFRYFPYINLSAQYFPVYAYLYAHEIDRSAGSLLLMLPFIFSHAAIFAYNNVMDLADPAFRKNPVAAGRISSQEARSIILICTLLSAAIFAGLYRAYNAWAIYLLYLLLGFAYSGMGLRLKESLAGPFVAAFIVWTAGPMIIVLEYGLMEQAMILSLIAAIYLIYVGREIYHTIIDLENDQRAGYQSFAIRTSSRTSRAALLTVFSVGCVCFLGSVTLYFNSSTLSHVSGTLIGLLVSMILFAIGVESQFLVRHTGYHPSTAFAIIRTCFILYGALMLDLPIMITALIMWAFLMGTRS